MELRQLKHDFQNNYLRLEVLLGLINEKLQKNETVDLKYLEDLKQFLELANEHLQHIKELE